MYRNNQTRRQIAEECSKLFAAQLLAKNHLYPLIDAMNLKSVLGQVNTCRRNLHSGRPILFEWLVTLPLWHIDAVIAPDVTVVAAQIGR